MHIHPQVIAENFDGHLLVSIKDSNKLLLFDPLACWIWEGLRSQQTISSIVDMIVEAYGADAGHVRKSVDSIIAEWQGTGLISAGTHKPLDLNQREKKSSDMDLNVDDICRLNTKITQTFCLNNKSFTISSDIDVFAQRVFSMFAHLAHDPDTDGPVFCLSLDDRRFIVSNNQVTVEATTDVFCAMSTLYNKVIEYCYPDLNSLAYFHAGAVAHNDNAVLMPAASGSGKSTLTAQLMLSGLTYLGDDVVPVQHDRTVRPFPTRLNVKSGSWPLLSDAFPALHTEQELVTRGRRVRYLTPMNLLPEDAAWPTIKAIVFPEYGMNESKTSLLKIQPATALQYLMKNGIGLGDPIEPANLTSLLEFLNSTPCYSLRYSSSEQAIAHIHNILSYEP